MKLVFIDYFIIYHIVIVMLIFKIVGEKLITAYYELSKDINTRYGIKRSLFEMNYRQIISAFKLYLFIRRPDEAGIQLARRNGVLEFAYSNKNGDDISVELSKDGSLRTFSRSNKRNEYPNYEDYERSNVFGIRRFCSKTGII